MSMGSEDDKTFGKSQDWEGHQIQCTTGVNREDFRETLKYLISILDVLWWKELKISKPPFCQK